MHEQGVHAPVAGMRVRASEERTADAVIAVLRQHGHAEFGMAIAPREVRCSDDAQFVVQNAEHRVALEIDSPHVSPNRKIVEAGAEAKPPVFARERQEMALQRRLRKARKFLDEDGHGSQYADCVTIRM